LIVTGDAPPTRSEYMWSQDKDASRCSGLTLLATVRPLL